MGSGASLRRTYYGGLRGEQVRRVVFGETLLTAHLFEMVFGRVLQASLNGLRAERMVSDERSSEGGRLPEPSSV